MNKLPLIGFVLFKDNYDAWLSPITRNEVSKFKVKYWIAINCIMILAATLYFFSLGETGILPRGTILFNILVCVQFILFLVSIAWTIILINFYPDLRELKDSEYIELNKGGDMELDSIIRPLCIEQGFLLKGQLNMARRKILNNNWQDAKRRAKTDFGLKE